LIRLTASRNETMTSIPDSAAIRAGGTVRANSAVSSGLLRLDLELDPALSGGRGFLPGQFAMLNLPGRRSLVFGRPFSILDWDGRTVSFLYRVVGRGTALMAGLEPGARMTFLGPLGGAFPGPRPDLATVLIGGGVGLPPMAAWLARNGRPEDRGYFGARDGADVPWSQLQGNWQVSVDVASEVPAGRRVFEGLVTDLVAQDPDLGDSRRRMVLACGPIPMLKAVANLAADRNWDCFVSLEEHMGCGYGACKGCVVPVVADSTAGNPGWRNATCCQEGPVFPAGDVLWNRYGADPLAITE